MTGALSFRSATLDDIETAKVAIIEAERSGTPRSLYERVFGLGEDDLRTLLDELLRAEVTGSELCCESFRLAIDEGEPVGAIAVWVEAQDGVSSSHLRASLLGHALGAERWGAARPRLELLREVDIPREPGALQIEAVYVAPGHRGKRVAPVLIERALDEHRARGIQKAQILSVVGNEQSRRAFLHAGFSITRETRSDRAELGAVLPGTGRILWERAI